MCYRMVRGCVTCEDGSFCATYGVECDELTIEDVTTEEGPLANFIETLNTLKLEPTHLRDALEDFVILHQRRRRQV